MESGRKSIRERYLAELDARDVTAPSGYVFRVRGMSKADFARINGGLPVLAGGAKVDDPQFTKAAKERWAIAEKIIYDEFVDGIVDPETGEVEKVPLDEIHSVDADVVIDSAMKRAGLGTPKAAEIARSL